MPFFGIEPAILDPVSGKELEGNNVEGVLVLKTPWPSIARTVYEDHNRYLETYMKVCCPVELSLNCTDQATSSHTLVYSTLVMVLLVMSTATSGSGVV